jgi:hypothetical protein
MIPINCRLPDVDIVEVIKERLEELNNQALVDNADYAQQEEVDAYK